jgi:hypothetical protein
VISTSILGASAAPAADPSTTTASAMGESDTGVGRYFRSSDATKKAETNGVEDIQSVAIAINIKIKAAFFFAKRRRHEIIKRMRDTEKGFRK